MIKNHKDYNQLKNLTFSELFVAINEFIKIDFSWLYIRFITSSENKVYLSSNWLTWFLMDYEKCTYVYYY